MVRQFGKLWWGVDASPAARIVEAYIRYRCHDGPRIILRSDIQAELRLGHGATSRAIMEALDAGLIYRRPSARPGDRNKQVYSVTPFSDDENQSAEKQTSDNQTESDLKEVDVGSKTSRSQPENQSAHEARVEQKSSVKSRQSRGFAPGRSAASPAAAASSTPRSGVSAANRMTDPLDDLGIGEDLDLDGETLAVDDDEEDNDTTLIVEDAPAATLTVEEPEARRATTTTGQITHGGLTATLTVERGPDGTHVAWTCGAFPRLLDADFRTANKGLDSAQRRALIVALDQRAREGGIRQPGKVALLVAADVVAGTRPRPNQPTKPPLPSAEDWGPSRVLEVPPWEM